MRKEPKWYVRDWATVHDKGQRIETFVACHLLKAVESWTDCGLGEFELAYLRDKQKREVDFIVVRDDKPSGLSENRRVACRVATAFERSALGGAFLTGQ